MTPYLIEKNGRFYFRRNFPVNLRPEKSSTYFIVKSLHEAKLKEAGAFARVFETFTGHIFERLGHLVQLGAVHIDKDAILAIRQGVQQVCEAWLEQKWLEKALAGPLAPQQVAMRQRKAADLVRQTEQAIAANNTEIVSEIFAEGMKLIGLDIDDDENLIKIAKFDALIAFNKAAILNKEREAGKAWNQNETLTVAAGPSNIVAFPRNNTTKAIESTAITGTTAAVTKTSANSNQKKTECGTFSEWYNKFANECFAVPGGSKCNTGRTVKDPKSIGDYNNVHAEFVAVCGNKQIDDYTDQDIKKYVDTLAELPKLNGKFGKNGTKGDKDRPVPTIWEQIKAANAEDKILRTELDEQVDNGTLRDSEAEQLWEEKSVKRLRATTINKRLSRLAKLFSFAREDMRKTNNINLSDHVTPNRLTEDPISKSYRRLDDHEVDLILASDQYSTASATPEKVEAHGICKMQKFGYWAPLFGIFAGLRLEEIGQIRLQDVRCRHNIHFIEVRRSELQSTKNSNANREVPIPQIILDLGFLDMVEARKNDDNRKSDWLFDELERDARMKRTALFSKSYGRWRAKLGLVGEGKDFHALRATFDTHALNLGIPDVIVASILGHSLKGETKGTYYKGGPLRLKKTHMDKVTYGFHVVSNQGKHYLVKHDDYQPMFECDDA